MTSMQPFGPSEAVRARQGGAQWHAPTRSRLACYRYLGEATKFTAGGLLEADKTYEAMIRLGLATSTGERGGRALFRGDIVGCHQQAAGAWLRGR
jgi:hypothetical protein